MSANPVDLIGGLANTSNVVKADVSAWAKARIAQVMASVSELRNTTLAAQLVVFVKSTGITYILDTTDTTTADDGFNCIISADGFRFKTTFGASSGGSLVLHGDGSGAAVFSAIVGADLPNPSASTLGAVFSKPSVPGQVLGGIDNYGNPQVALTGQPYLYASLAGVQSLTSATITAILLTAIADSGGYYNAGTGQYKPLVAGTYMVCFTFVAQATLWASAGANTEAWVSKNGIAGGAGTTVTTGLCVNATTAASATSQASGCAIVAMNGTTDTLELDGFVAATTAPAAKGGTGTSQGFTSLTITRIGP